MASMKVLVVDDEVQYLNVLAFKFRNAGLDVLTARDGQEALVVALAERPALIVSDYQNAAAGRDGTVPEAAGAAGDGEDPVHPADGARAGHRGGRDRTGGGDGDDEQAVQPEGTAGAGDGATQPAAGNRGADRTGVA